MPTSEAIETVQDSSAKFSNLKGKSGNLLLIINYKQFKIKTKVLKILVVFQKFKLVKKKT